MPKLFPFRATLPLAKADVFPLNNQPSLYIYYQLFGNNQCQKGFVALIDPLDSSCILQHEATFPDHVQSTIASLEKVNTQIQPTFGLYDDPSQLLEPIMDEIIQQKPHEWTDPKGVIHQLKPLTDPSKISLFQEVLSERKILLADGHHRLAASKHLSTHQAKSSSDHKSYHMMYLVNAFPRLKDIKPFHKMYKVNPENREGLWAELKASFNLSLLPSGPSLAELPKEGFYLLWGKEIYSLGYKAHSSEFPVVSTLLQIDKVIEGLKPGIINYAYTEDEVEFYDQLDNGQFDFGILFPALPLEEIISSSENGIILPPKSTNFYPKPAENSLHFALDGGLVANRN